MKTRGEIESAIGEAASRFERDFMGRGPMDVHAHLLDDFVIIRLKGVLTAAEKQLVKTLPPERGRDLVKQVRTHLVETARPMLDAIIEDVTGVKPISLHHDISTNTGEEIMMFTLASTPTFRDAKPR